MNTISSLLHGYNIYNIFIYLSIYLSIHLSIYPSFCLFVYACWQLLFTSLKRKQLLEALKSFHLYIRIISHQHFYRSIVLQTIYLGRRIRPKEMSLYHKLKFPYPYIFANWWCNPLIFQTLFVWLTEFIVWNIYILIREC